MKPILYYNPLSPFAHKCRVALIERGVAFDLKLPDSFGTGDPDTAFLALNPRGEVPVLIDGEAVIWDSPIILRYIQDRWPLDTAVPQTPAARAQSEMIELVCDTRLDPVHWGLGEAKWFGRVSGEKLDRLMERSRAQSSAILAWLQDQLGDEPWFNGTSFGDIDACVAIHVSRGVGHGLAPDLEGGLGKWLARAQQRPSVAEVLTSADAWFGSLTPEDIARWMTAKRQYRDHRLAWMIDASGFEPIADAHSAGRIFITT